MDEPCKRGWPSGRPTRSDTRLKIVKKLREAARYKLWKRKNRKALAIDKALDSALMTLDRRIAYIVMRERDYMAMMNVLAPESVAVARADAAQTGCKVAAMYCGVPILFKDVEQPIFIMSSDNIEWLKARSRIVWSFCPAITGEIYP